MCSITSIPKLTYRMMRVRIKVIVFACSFIFFGINNWNLSCGGRIGRPSGGFYNWESRNRGASLEGSLTPLPRWRGIFFPGPVLFWYLVIFGGRRRHWWHKIWIRRVNGSRSSFQWWRRIKACSHEVLRCQVYCGSFLPCDGNCTGTNSLSREIWSTTEG